MVMTIFFNSIILLFCIYVCVLCLRKFFTCHIEEAQGRILFSKSQTDSIRGIAVLMVMFSHVAVQLSSNGLDYGTGIGEIIRLVICSWGAIGVGIFFLLSGYGNAVSHFKLYKQDSGNISLFNNFKWALNKIIRLLLSFIISFLFVVIITKLFNVNSFTNKQLLIEFISLRLPDCTTWYLKTQGIFYFCIPLSSCFVFFLLRTSYSKSELKYRICILTLLFILSLVYFFVSAIILKQSDFWWKTSLCFWFGFLVFACKQNIEKLFNNKRDFVLSLIFLFLSFVVSYVYIFKIDYNFFHLFAYIFISCTICIFLDQFIISSKLLNKIGSFSLELYLIHIGLVDLFNYKIDKEWGGVLMITVFFVLSFVFAIITNKICSKLNSILRIK